MDPLKRPATSESRGMSPASQAAGGTGRPRVATAWLGGCSGCHMSFVDLDERLIELAPHFQLVYSPLMDVKEFPENVDATLVEGAVCNEQNLHEAKLIRARSKVVVSFGDCAVTGNVPAMRNPLRRAEPVLKRAYIENADVTPRRPSEPGIVPTLFDRVRPLHEVVPVDLHLPGCPPSADLIHFVLSELVAGRTPDLHDRLRYG
jgi:NAD-reducing hydrogenase small subunit